MKKRGTVLIVLAVFILILSVLTSASSSETGCCTNPELASVCTQLTESACCTSAESYDSCVSSYFYPDTPCASVPNNLCDSSLPVCCIDSNYPDSFCNNLIQYRAQCQNRSAFVNQQCSVVPACQQGCCICQNENKITYTTDQANPIKTASECLSFCSNIPVPHKIGIHNTSITNAQQCLQQYFDFYSTAEISGYIKDLAGNAISNAVITINTNQTLSNQQGFYHLEEIVPAKSKQIQINHSDYDVLTVQRDLKAGKNYYNFTLVKAGFGKVNGTVTNEQSQPIFDATVKFGIFSAKTDIHGYYEINNLPLASVYEAIAFKETLQSDKKTIPLTKDTVVNFIIAKKSLAVLSGTVSGDGVPVKGATIKIIDKQGKLQSRATTSSYQGIYKIENIEVAPDATSTFIVTASKSGFESASAEVILSSEKETHLDLNLAPFNPACGYTLAAPVNDLSANHIKGEKAVLLTWSNPCITTAGFYLFKKDDFGKSLLAYFDSTEPNQFFSFKDSDVKWNTSYTYEIIAVYDIAGNSSPSTSAITLGNRRCENNFAEFCFTKKQRRVCNDFNQITTEGLTGQYANCSNPDLGDNSFCTGPDQNGLTFCKDESACSPLALNSPFGIYTTMPQCYGSFDKLSNQFANYCYYDFSDTTLDKCSSCSQIKSCYDYNSKLACLNDKYSCSVGKEEGCAWIDVNPELGKGICYQIGYKSPPNKCNLCSENSLFFNQNCNQQVCSKLGNCFSNQQESSCISCDENARCESYHSKDACGTQPFSINEDRTLRFSNDACSIGYCYWNGTSCFKDGNADKIPDCASTDINCQNDKTPPTTTTEDYLVVTADNPSIVFKSDQPATVYYCIVSNPDTPCLNPSQWYSGQFTAGNMEYSANLNNYLDGDWQISGIDKYYVKFYSIDKKDNREQLKTKRFFADLTPPEVYVDSETIPKTNSKGDLIIDITATERVICSDNISSSESSSSALDSTPIDISKQITYQNMDYGEYTYNIVCKDSAGNPVHYSKILYVEDPFITISNPQKAIKSTSFKFEIITKNESTCGLYENALKETLSTTDNKFHTSSLYSFAPNMHYVSYNVRCTFEGGERTKNIPFTIDQLAPETSAVITSISKTKQATKTANNWLEPFNEEVNVKLECKDYPPLGFGCKQTKYCLTPGCTPEKTYLKEIKITNSTTICYQSTDREFEEPVKCGQIIIEHPFGIKIKNPTYGVSSTPNFNVEITTKKPTAQCKYSALPFKFDSISDQRNIFQRTSPFSYKKENFPSIFGYNLTAVSPVYNWPELPPSQYNMYVICKDTGGDTNEDYPALFEIYYDPTPPIISKAYSSNPGGSPSSVITEKNAQLTVKTDDDTICKFSKTKQNYNSMEYSFPGTELKQFSKIHQTLLTNLADSSTNNYYIMCMNKAENFSEAKQISFAVDRTQSGAIIKAEAQYKDENIIFHIETNREAVCSYFNGFEKPISTYPSIIHEIATSEFTEEKRYTVEVKCTFASTGLSKTAEVSFAVDNTPPTMTDIIIGDHVCNPNEIRPQFKAEDADNLSEIIEYNYTLYEETGLFDQIIKTGITTDASSKIQSPSLQENSTYYIEVSAKDAVGLWSLPLKSDSFDLLGINSTFCQETGPPTVTIQQTANPDGTKDITLLCEDESGCDGMYYGLNPVEEDCMPLEEYYSPILVENTTYLCYEVYDTTGNNATGSSRIMIGALNDEDGDTISNDKDMCPDTPYSELSEIVTDPGSPNYGCSPSQIDSDSDGMPDFWELLYNLNPNDPSDRDEDPDNDSSTNIQEYLEHTDPTIAELGDSDNDGILDNLDQCPNTPSGEIVNAEGCSLSQIDSDGDKMDDAWELLYNLNPNNASDADLDSDNDGLTNLEEYSFKTNPTKKDTDGDGFSDFDEVNKGYDPVDASDHPEKSFLFPVILLILGLLLVAVGLVLFYKEKLLPKKPKQHVLPIRPVRQKIYPVKPVQPKPSLENKKQKIIEKLKKERKEKERKRKEFFEVFEKRKKQIPQKKINLPSLKKVFEKPKFKPIPKKITIPEKKTEFEKLANLTEKHLTQRTSSEPILKLTGVSKKHFDRLKSLIKERAHIKPSQEKLTPKQRKQIKNIFEELKKLKKKKTNQKS